MQTHGVIIKVAIMSLLVSGLGVTGCTGSYCQKLCMG